MCKYNLCRLLPVVEKNSQKLSIFKRTAQLAVSVPRLGHTKN